MKTFIVTAVAVGLFASPTVQAQGSTYLSNLGQAIAGSSAVGSDSWLATQFITGNNSSGYALNSVQFGMTNAFGNPNGFTAMIYSALLSGPVALPKNDLGSLTGSLNPVASGVYTYIAPGNLTLRQNTIYFIILTAGTSSANGAYEWSFAALNSYNPNGGWSVPVVFSGTFLHSNNGSSWNSIPSVFPQFTINATAIPEPSAEMLSGFGGILFLELLSRRRLNQNHFQ